MKTLITIASLLVLSHTSMAQIKIPNANKKIEVNKKIETKTDLNVKTIAVPKSINIRKFKNLKPEQIAKLPAARVNRQSVLNLRINKSWEITPSRFSDKDMHVVEYFGKHQKNQRYISIYPENKYYSRLNNNAPGFLPEMRYLVLKFNPEMGKRYRIIIKLKPGVYRGKKVMTNVTGSRNDIWYINYQYNEVMFDFEASSKEIKISPVIAGSESYYTKYEPLEIEKINIDKVEE
ncbi:hypothetical protein OOZ15_03135 [Galbibacter sp. EGI 63066]|uniref:hypothetical protein n=1 Tax=Galbibacter sp. EGI 63066 TaxID=2993559 RepID=UPI0022497A74|nr:hypothetical protein [Galbibacter sp. EGI 63066]MCX2678924.1 hypothetical protein [Galbibacter sp. EGI 63066]